MVNYYSFKDITVVPKAKVFVDIILSKLQRKTPTVIRKRNPMPMVRKFYTRKVRTAQQFFTEKLDQIINNFPHVDRLHPFYSELIRIHYDKDRYCIALANCNRVKHKIEKVGQDIVRRLKYGESLYQCKCQKRAALGQMVKYVLKLKETLAYLEEVRQKMARLPCIDPTSRTLLLCGFPNVGKSSFLNRVTRADVEVQPYAFTTKCLYLGHTDYEYGRYQVIDTPGLLDRDLSERNETEWATITALTCLDACILYLLDVSLECGHSLAEQLRLFDSLRPCFRLNPVVVAVNKTDVRSMAELSEEEREVIRQISERPGVHSLLEMSTLGGQGVMEVRNKACGLLLERRLDEQARQAADDEQRLFQLRTRTTVIQPAPSRKRVFPLDPAVVEERELRLQQRIADRECGDDEAPPKQRRRLERDRELELGEDYDIDLRGHWQLAKPDERYDHIPEVWQGYNLIDFYDPNISERLAQLEEEEQKLVAAGFYDPEPPETEDEKRIRRLADKIRQVMALRRLENREKKVKKPRLGRREANTADMQREVTRLGLEVQVAQAAHVQAARSRSLKRDTNRRAVSPVDHARSESRPRPRSESGVRDLSVAAKLREQSKCEQRKRLNRTARRGDADRHIPDLKPKHLFSGKRGIGKNDRR